MSIHFLSSVTSTVPQSANWPSDIQTTLHERRATKTWRCLVAIVSYASSALLTRSLRDSCVTMPPPFPFTTWIGRSYHNICPLGWTVVFLVSPLSSRSQRVRVTDWTALSELSKWMRRCTLTFLIHLKLALLTELPASNELKINTCLKSKADLIYNLKSVNTDLITLYVVFHGLDIHCAKVS